MRIVYVAGFFNPVLTELQKRLKEQMDARTVVWIPQFSNGELDVNRFHQSFLDVVARGATEVLVLLVVFRGQEQRSDIFRAIVEQGKTRSENLVVRITEWKNARDVEWIIAQVELFKPIIHRPAPPPLHKLADWVRENHGDRVFLHPRAATAAKKSQYGDVELIYAAINLIGKEYWEMKTAPPCRASTTREAFTAKLQELGLEMSPSISSSRAGEEGEDYFVKYPLGTKEKCFLEQHLKKGSDREERFCLRIYFFWHEKSKKTVIGWLPSHLGTRAS